MTKSAIVTGSSRGIGKAIALRLAADGFAVTVNYTKGKDEALHVIQEIEKTGGKAIAVQANVASSSDVKTLFDETIKAFGGIDVLVNNAGVMSTIPLATTTDEDIDRMFNINVKGSVYAMREAARVLNEGGRIINFSSSANALKIPGYATYCATKAAIETYTHILSKELGSKKITVNAVAPGPVETELFMVGKTDEVINGLIGRTPLSRLGQPEDIANVVSFLASEESSWITGQVLRANGGIA